MAPNSRPRRETVAAPSHPTLLLPAVCNLWSNSSMLPYSNINKRSGKTPRPPSGLVNIIESAAANHRGKGRRTSRRPTPLKTSQHDMIERHVAGPHQEPRDFKPTPNDMGSSLVQRRLRVLTSGQCALSRAETLRSFICMMDKTAKNEGAVGKRAD
jgi:hypothetical protein